MALIGRIRKNFWFVLIVIFGALASFVLMDMMGANNAGGVSGQFNVGEINGDALDYRDFQTVEQALYSGTGDLYGAKQAVWDYLVERSLVTQESDAIGLKVPTEELKNLLFGANPADVVRAMYTDPNTGQFNRQALLDVKQAIEGGQQLNPTFESRWAEIEKQVRKTKLEDKLGMAVSKGMYTPTWMAEQKAVNDKKQLSFDYVKIPFDFIDDDIEVSDDDISAFIKGKEDRYKTDQETRSINYIMMEVVPTVADTNLRRSEVNDLIGEFKITDNDSLFAINHEGFYSPYYNKKEDLPEPVRDAVESLEVGDIYGPYFDNDNFFAMKLIDSKSVPDSVEARHILISTDPTQGGKTVAEAEAFVDSLMTVLKRGRESFDSLAIKHSQDPGSSFNGGDLGTFQQGRMVGPFNEVCFHTGRTGGMYSVTTEYGVHLIEIRDIVYNDRDNDYEVAFIRSPIIPSDETQNKMENEMADLIAEHRDWESLSNAVSGREDIATEKAGPFASNDYLINNLGGDQTSRDIIKWAFEADNEIGDVSPELYTYSDEINYFDNKYIIASLESIDPPGLPAISSLRFQVETEILKQKRGEMIQGQISGTDLSAIASQYGAEVESVQSVTFSTRSIPGLGSEPKLISKLFGMTAGSSSQPIIGNNGVYIIKANATSEVDNSSSNIPFVRSVMNTSARSQTALYLMNSLKEKAEVVDSRARFY